MANKSIAAVKSSMPIPPEWRGEHNDSTEPRVKWFNETINQKSSLTTTHGDIFSTGNVQNVYGNGELERSIWQSNGKYGFKLTAKNGNSHDALYEFKGTTNRYQKASIYNGIAFQLHTEGDFGTRMYVSKIALTWKRDKANEYRHWGIDFISSNASPGYHYYAMRDSSEINTIRGWGKPWLFFGITLYIRNSSGMAHTSTVKMWDVRLHHKTSTQSKNHRLILPKMRSDADRAKLIY